MEYGKTRKNRRTSKVGRAGGCGGTKDLACLYLQGGSGFKRDVEKYLEWMTKAAEQGDAGAQFNLGMSFGMDYNEVPISKKHKDMPDISIAGECECDPDHGIAIGFRDMNFLGVGPEDYAGF